MQVIIKTALDYIVYYIQKKLGKLIFCTRGKKKDGQEHSTILWYEGTDRGASARIL